MIGVKCHALLEPTTHFEPQMLRQAGLRQAPRLICSAGTPTATAAENPWRTRSWRGAGFTPGRGTPGGTTDRNEQRRAVRCAVHHQAVTRHRGLYRHRLQQALCLSHSVSKQPQQRGCGNLACEFHQNRPPGMVWSEPRLTAFRLPPRQVPATPRIRNRTAGAMTSSFLSRPASARCRLPAQP